MAKRMNKELEDKMSIIHEKLNEHLSTIYSNEIEIEKLTMNLDKALSEREGISKERDHFRVGHDSLQQDCKTFEERLEKLYKDHEELQLQLTEKEKSILTFETMQKVYEDQFQSFIKKTKVLEQTIQTLENTNLTLVEQNKVYAEENERLKFVQDEMNVNIKKLNEERNRVNDLLEAADRKIASFIEQIHHNEEVIARLNKEITKTKNTLVHAERYSDALEIK
jgi:chromosome segregation ATPase